MILSPRCVFIGLKSRDHTHIHTTNRQHVAQSLKLCLTRCVQRNFFEGASQIVPMVRHYLVVTQVMVKIDFIPGVYDFGG